MSSKIVEYTSKTQLYLRVKKPLLERQRRARINKCLDALKALVAEFQGDDAILRMDKAEMLESTIVFLRTQAAKQALHPALAQSGKLPMDSYRNGYMNAVNEVSRVMAATPGISVELGKAVMTHLGYNFNRLLHCDVIVPAVEEQSHIAPLSVQTDSLNSASSLSPASSGYHSDFDENSNTATSANKAASVWRPW